MFEKAIIIKGPYRLIHLEKVNPRELFDLVIRNKEYLSPWMPWIEFTNSVNDTENFINETIEMKGIKRESEKIKNRFIDHYLFSFLRREWKI